MLNLRLGEIAVWTRGRLIGSDTVVHGVTTDTRTVREGDLFVALKGARVDAHEFLDAARAAGAAAALVEVVVRCARAVGGRRREKARVLARIFEARA